MITYLDRACIATLAPGIIRDLGLSHDPDGLCVHRLSAGLRAVRDSHRVVGGPQGHAVGAVAHRAVVVLPHGGDGRGVQLSRAARHPLSVRRRRSGRVAVRRPHVFTLDSRSRARNGPGHLLRRRASGRRPDAGAGALAAPLHVLARDFRLLRRASASSGWRCGTPGSATIRRSIPR